MDLFTCDVLVVGGGGAGLRAAIAVAETHPKLRVSVISKVYPMRSHTVSAEGGAAAVIKAEDSLDEHAYDTISGGDWLTDQDAVEAFVREAPEEMLRLEHWGCPWSREPDGHIAVRPFGGMKIERTWFAADKTGFHLLHTLFQTTLKYQAIERFDEWTKDGVRGSWPSNCPPGRSGPSSLRRSSSARGVAARFSRSPPMPTSRTATGWPWPIAPEPRSRTWSLYSTTRPVCHSPGS